MSRLLGKADLENLARPPRQELADVLERGDWEAGRVLWADIRTAYCDFLTLYRRWVACLQEFILANHGREALAEAARLESVVVGILARGVSADLLATDPDDGPDPVDECLRQQDPAAALSAFDSIEQAVRYRHDALRDWISQLLSYVYRKHGIEALKGALRHCSEILWMPWMMEEFTRDPAQRVREWTRLLKANFGNIRVEEDDEAFTVIQDPCGSCGRQENEGRYEGTAALAMITEKDPLTFMHGNVTAYRTHIAMMHFIMPIERIGAPWPTILCPSTKGGVCRILIYKDPRRALPEHYRSVGLARPG